MHIALSILDLLDNLLKLRLVVGYLIGPIDMFRELPTRRRPVTLARRWWRNHIILLRPLLPLLRFTPSIAMMLPRQRALRTRPILRHYAITLIPTSSWCAWSCQWLRLGR